VENTRQAQMLEEFEAWLQEHPGVWGLFCRFTREAKAAGKRSYGAQVVVERMRWHVEIDTGGDSVKVNNNHVAFLSRLWNMLHPPANGDRPFYRTRICRSADRPRSAGGVRMDRAPDPGEENELQADLERILRKVTAPRGLFPEDDGVPT